MEMCIVKYEQRKQAEHGEYTYSYVRKWNITDMWIETNSMFVMLKI